MSRVATSTKKARPDTTKNLLKPGICLTVSLVQPVTPLVESRCVYSGEVPFPAIARSSASEESVAQKEAWNEQQIP